MRKRRGWRDGSGFGNTAAAGRIGGDSCGATNLAAHDWKPVWILPSLPGKRLRRCVAVER